VHLSFTRDPSGAVVHRSIRLDAPADLSVPLELFQAAFAQRFALPMPRSAWGAAPDRRRDRRGRSSEAPLLFLYKERAAISGPVNAPVEGGVWIGLEARGRGRRDAVMKVALTHAYTGENGPKDARAVTIEYRAKLEGERTFDLVDGA